MRHQSREIALQILFQMEFAPQIRISQFMELYGETFNQNTLNYADIIVQGVRTHLEKIDQMIQSASSHWKISRMAIIDRNILRMATYEMKFMPDSLKPNIVINESIELAKKYGAEESSKFVNGLLDQISRSQA